MTTALALAEQVRTRGAVSATDVVEPPSGRHRRVRRRRPRLSRPSSTTRPAPGGGRSTDRVAAGEDPGPLAGVPVAVKDNLCTRGVPTTCSSRILDGWCPPYDATVVERLRGAGAVVVGQDQPRRVRHGLLDGELGLRPHPQPLRADRVPGGSSGGSAAAVAAGLVPLALGSDTGGSIRQPAALCGVVGMKPTYGTVSRYGLVAFASSLDQIGPVQRHRGRRRRRSSTPSPAMTRSTRPRSTGPRPGRWRTSATGWRGCGWDCPASWSTASPPRWRPRSGRRPRCWRPPAPP